MKRVFAVSAMLIAVLVSLTGAEVIDRIAAVVNDDIILLSEVEEKMFILQAQGQLQGVDSSQVSQIRRDILDRLIEEKLVVHRANSQGIEIEEGEVTSQVDDAMERVRGRFPTIEAFREALSLEGITESMLRERYENDVKQELLGQRIVGREVRGKVKVDWEDVRAYYIANLDKIPPKPDEIRLAHVVTYPISQEQESKAEKKATDAFTRIQAGEDFETVAKALSDDPSATKGGLLGWFDPGDLDASFEAVIDTLPEGQLSAVTRTPFGYHVIEVMERDGAKFRVRHILALVKSRPEDEAAAKARIDKAAAALAGGRTFIDVVKTFSEDENTRDAEGDLGWTPTQFLLPNVLEVINALDVGGVSTVVQSDRGFHIFKLVERRQTGSYEYEEIKDQLRQLVEKEKLEAIYDEWLNAVRDSAYVEVKGWER